MLTDKIIELQQKLHEALSWGPKFIVDCRAKHFFFKESQVRIPVHMLQHPGYGLSVGDKVKLKPAGDGHNFPQELDAEPVITPPPGTDFCIVAFAEITYYCTLHDHSPLVIAHYCILKVLSSKKQEIARLTIDPRQPPSKKVIPIVLFSPGRLKKILEK